MLVGVVAFNVLKVMDPSDTRALGVLLTGYFFQGILSVLPFVECVDADLQTGLGFFMTFFYLCIYVIRCVFMMARKWLRLTCDYIRVMSVGLAILLPHSSANIYY